MARVIGQPSQASKMLLLIALTCAIGWSTSNAAVLGAGDRKLLQGSSTPFGAPAPGTLVVTWSAVPAKTGLGDGPQPAPYQYNYYNLYQAGSGNVSVLFYAENAYVAGPGNQRTELPSSGGCDVNTTRYPDQASAINSCRGNFTVPTNLTVSVVDFALQAPAGLEFQVPTPFNGFNCTAALFPSDFNVAGTYDERNLEAVFGSGATIPMSASTPPFNFNTYFTILNLESQPFTGTGTLRFQSINIRIRYNTPVQLPQGLTLSWVIPYAFCFFASKDVTVQNVGSGTPAPGLTRAPSTVPTPTTTGCASNPCGVGGLCTPIGVPYTCTCLPGFFLASNTATGGSQCVPNFPEPYETF